MAVTYRFPVLVWKNQDEWWAAGLLEWDETAGVGRSAADAVEQVCGLLAWRYEESPWLSAPDFLDAHLVQTKVPVRPEYQESGRRFPCEEAVLLRVAYVSGRQE